MFIAFLIVRIISIMNINIKEYVISIGIFIINSSNIGFIKYINIKDATIQPKDTSSAI